MGIFGRNKQAGADEKYQEQLAKASKEPDGMEKVRIRFYDSYGNKGKNLNVRVKSENDFLEKARKRVAAAFEGSG